MIILTSNSSLFSALKNIDIIFLMLIVTFNAKFVKRILKLPLALKELDLYFLIRREVKNLVLKLSLALVD